MVSMGLVPNTVLGLDAAGVIKRVGPKVSLVKPGDRVATFLPGAFKNFLRTHETLVQKLPTSMTYEIAASLPCAYITAYQALIEIGRLSQGETVLIHSATGGKYYSLCHDMELGEEAKSFHRTWSGRNPDQQTFGCNHLRYRWLKGEATIPYR